MIVMKKHAQAILQLAESGKYRIEEGGEEEKTLIELERENLVRLISPLEYTLTFWGKELSDVLRTMISRGLLKSPEVWDENFRWIGSEVVSMIYSAKNSNGKAGNKVKEKLVERGFADSSGNINEFAEKVFEIYNSATPVLEIDENLAEVIRKIPQGPGERNLLPKLEHEINLLEAMRLIVFSIPNAQIYALTGLGQAVKEVLEIMPKVGGVLISEDILESFIKALDEGLESLPEKSKEILFSLGLFDGEGQLLQAGEKLLEVYRLWRARSFAFHRTFHIEIFEQEILKAIESIEEKRQKGASILPTREEIVNEMFVRPLKEYKYLLSFYGRKIDEDFNYKKKEEIRKKFEELKTVEELFKHFYEKGGRWRAKMMELVTQALYSLESFQLVETALSEKGKIYYKLTEYGRKVLEDVKKHGVREISATAVKAITVTKREFISPNREWYEEAVEQNLVRNGVPTESGKLYSYLAYNIKRKPHLTKFELMVLRRIPKSGMFLSELFASFDEVLKEEVHLALEKLQARGLLDILPNEGLLLTRAGELMKEATSPIPEGIVNPINPLLYKIVEAIAKVGTLYVKEEKIRVTPKQLKEIRKLTGLDEETFSSEIALLRVAGLLGQNSLLKSGIKLIEAVKEIQREYHKEGQ